MLIKPPVPILKLPPAPELYNRKVVMLWTESLHADALEMAKQNDISLSELSRIAMLKILKEGT